MDKSLCDKLNFLSSKDVRDYYIRLYEVLNDRHSASKYGMNDSDYDTLPKEKVEGIEEKIYKEMFENIKVKKYN